MKKAFSLIEIMQTVILLGIIAGLSISFFKRIDSNERLFVSTEKKLQGVINEVDKQICSDATPVCIDNSGNIFRFEDLSSSIGWNCASVYQNSAFNPATGMCEKAPTGGTCENDFVAVCPYGNDTDDPSKTKCETKLKGMILYENRCYAPLPCPNPRGVWNDNRTDQHLVETYEAVNLSKMTCPYGIPDYSQELVVNGTRYSVFCIKLHDLIPHKKQGNSDADDLRETCDSFTAFQTPLNAQNNENDVKNYVKNIISTNANDSNLDKYNMRLPNGVVLYNLNGTINPANNRAGDTNSNGAKNIFIKYDRIGSARTAVYGTNMKTFRVYNPLLETTDSATGNPILDERPRNDLPGTTYNDNCAVCNDSSCPQCVISQGTPKTIKQQIFGESISESPSTPEETPSDPPGE